jgi:hypothetical protein
VRQAGGAASRLTFVRGAVQHATAPTSPSPCFARNLLVQRQQQIEKPGIPQQGLVQVNLSFRFSQRKEKAPRARRQAGSRGFFENVRSAPAARMMTSHDIRGPPSSTVIRRPGLLPQIERSGSTAATRGLRPGVLAVLHTWNQRLGAHPHIHCLVAGGPLAWGKRGAEGHSPRTTSPIGSRAVRSEPTGAAPGSQ